MRKTEPPPAPTRRPTAAADGLAAADKLAAADGLAAGDGLRANDGLAPGCGGGLTPGWGAADELTPGSVTGDGLPPGSGTGDGLPPGVPPGRPLTLPGRGTTWVREAGTGAPGAPALVLLHGWTVTAALNWVHVFAPLAAEFRVVALDHRGHGRGIAPSRMRRFRFDDCADDVVALADALGIEQVVPVGYSMGGPVAALTWHRHADRVAGMVLCATSRHFPSSSGSRSAGLAVRGGVLGVAAALRSAPPVVRQRATAAILERRAARLPDWALAEVAWNDPAALVEAFAELRAFDAAPWIGEIDVPTAVVVTTEDQVVPPARQRQLADDIPGASVWPVEGDHSACVTAPEAFVPALIGACRWVTARAHRR